jgi:hypothetical protein
MHILALEGDIDLFQYVLKPQIDDHPKDVLRPKLFFFKSWTRLILMKMMMG